MSSFTVLHAGVASTVQDLGRPGLAHLGISPSGLIDPQLGALLNRAVGNGPDAALVETAGGLVIRADTALIVVSSVAPVVTPIPVGRVYEVPADSERAWSYLAVRGGVAVAPTLGSRSTDTLSGLGPPALVAGGVLAVGDDPGQAPFTETVPVHPLPATVRVTPGPRRDWFDGNALALLCDAPIRVTSTSRVGVRLAGPTLTRVRHTELPSEGLVRGAIQVPPSGELVMMSADHPTTGGYPVVAVVHPDDVAIVAQHRPGIEMRFRYIAD